MILRNYEFHKQIEQLRVIPSRMNNAILKFNTKKFSFWLKVFP